MIQGLKPYPAYKDAGVPWLGEVPAHWEVRPVGGMGQLFKGKGGNKGDEVPAGIPCVRYGDLYTRHEFFITKSKSYVSKEQSAAYTPIRHGDVLFAASGETEEDIGRSSVNLIEGEARCGGDVLVLRPEIPVAPRFLGYAADSPASRRQKACMGRGFTVVHIYGSQLKRLLLPLPPLPEQTAIVRFLGHVDRKIQRAIRAKQKLIKLLEEEKQVLIHRAVTGQIDVRTGKPYPAYKPSGVEWLGDVPEHWEVVRLGSLLKERGETNDKGTVTDVLSLLRNRGIIPYDEKGNIGNKKSDDITRYKIVRPDDIVLNCMNVIIGSVGLSRYTGCLSPVYYVLVRRGEDSPQYLNAIFQAPLFHRSLVKIGNGILAHRMRIPMELLKCEPLPRPPVEEQRHIVRFMDETTAWLVATQNRATRETELLREYRTRLVADVVTGKLDVREAAARLPAEPEAEMEATEPEEDLDLPQAAEEEGSYDDAVRDEA